MTQGRAGTFIVALLLMGASGVLWTAGTRDARLADAQRSLVTLQFARAAREASALREPGPLGRRMPGAADAAAEIRAVRAAAGYIESIATDDAAAGVAGAAGAASARDTARNDAARREAAASGETADGRAPFDAESAGDPFIEANRTFRAAFASIGDAADAAPAGGRAAAAARRIALLDRAIGQYAELLRADPRHVDAAYNYELAIRQRAAIASAAASPSASASTPASPSSSSTPRDSGVADGAAADGIAPRGWSLHGYEGAAPAGVDGKSFKLIVPMRPDERHEAERAGKSGPRQRKG